MSSSLAPVETPELFFPHVVNNDRSSIVSNIKTNSERGLPELEQVESVDTPLVIAAGGPSLLTRLPILKALLVDSHLMTINGAYKHMMNRGIESDHFVMLDSREDNICHVELPGRANHLLASQVHPDVFDRLTDHKVTIFHAGTETGVETLAGQDKNFLTAPIGIASIYAVYIAAALGYRNLMLFGYDFSHDSGERYAFDQPMNHGDDVLEINLGDKTFKTTATLVRTADQFVGALSPVIRACDMNIKVCSDGLLPAMLEYANNPATEESEREKYEEIWGIESYRKVSPGLRYIEEAVKALDIPKGASVADFGCGTGRVVKWLIDHGFDGIGVDIASNALEEEVPFVQSALWNALPKVQYGFTTDVLEHIPTEKVRKTLKRIHDACEVGCYLNIDTVPDTFGILIGKRLHLTVMSAEDWGYELSRVWASVKPIHTTNKQAIFVCKR